MTPNTDVLIPIHGTREFPVEHVFEQCVETVIKNTRNFRFIFVDDACDDICSNVIRRVAESFPYSIVVRTNKQRWFSRAVNLGLRMVRTPWAVELNCDTVVDAGWLD